MKRIGVFLLLLISATYAFAANVSVPNFQLITRGNMEGSSFGLTTRSIMDIELEGGVKFGGIIRFGFDSDNLGDSTSLPDSYDREALEAAIERSLSFQLAAVTIRNIANLPLNFTYFSGALEQFTTGSTFPRAFGSIPFATHYSGYVYFPEGVIYDGIYDVAGTGVRLATNESLGFWGLELYGYQDQYLGSGFYSSDVRFLLNTEFLKLDVFAGATFPSGPAGTYRGGVMMYYDTGFVGQFFAQIGVPRWTPFVDGALGIDDFFFLFEPRLVIGPTQLSLTFFRHPIYYQQQASDQSGSIDINVKVRFGNPFEQLLTGGVEVVTLFKPNDGSGQFALKAAPFLSFNSSGVLWDTKVNFNVLPFSFDSLIEAFIGIRTEL